MELTFRKFSSLCACHLRVMMSNRKDVPNPSNFLRLMSFRLPKVRSAIISEILSGYL